MQALARHNDARLTRRTLGFGGSSSQREQETLDSENAAVLLQAVTYMEAACDYYTVLQEEMGVVLSLETHRSYEGDISPIYEFDVVLSVRGKINERVRVNANGKNYAMAVGGTLRLLGFALDKCAEKHALDAKRRAFLQTHIMQRSYVMHIEALEDEQKTKRRRKEAQRRERLLDCD
jgi:hypothetical protein